MAKIEQKLGLVKEEHTQFGEYKEDPHLSSFLPPVLLQTAEKHMAEIDVALEQLVLVLTDGWIGDFKQVLARTSKALEDGQASNKMLLDMVQMATTMQGNA